MFDALATFLVFDLAGLTPATPLGAALHFFVMDVAKILVLLTTVIYLMGWLRALLTPERVRAMMKGRSGPGARLMAVGLGAVTPFCSCSSIPLFIGFVEAGIPLGVTLSFLIASPMVDLAAIAVLLGVIGWQTTLIYVLTGLTIAFAGGYILQAFKLERWVEDYVWKIRMGEAQIEVEEITLRARHDYAWNEVRQIETMHGSTGHSEILIEDLRVSDSAMLGGRGQGHRLGQYRLGPARLAHCMRWIAQAEVALDMMVERSLDRYSHGSILAEKQGVQWLIADSAMELYQCKLMVLHAAYKIDRGDDFSAEVSMAKHFVANSLNRIIDRSIQVHGALGYSTDTPLAHMYQQARWARFADGADEIHQMRIAQRTIAAWRDHGSTRAATGDLPI